MGQDVSHSEIEDWLRIDDGDSGTTTSISNVKMFDKCLEWLRKQEELDLLKRAA